MARRARRHGFPVWAVPSLLLAAGLFTASKLGYGDSVEQAAQQLGSNTQFVEAALATEMGTLAAAEQHEPASVGAEELAHAQRMPSALTQDSERNDTGAETALVSESMFRPPKEVQSAQADEDAPTQTADGADITELTITGESGGYPGQDGVYVQNDSGLSYDLDDMLSNPFKITQNSSKKQPTVFILHTHASEAYVDQNGAHSEDTEKNVVHIGDVIEQELEAKGIGVVHCRTLIDVPSYNQSYNRAMEIIDEQMEETPSVKVILDVHRDSMITDSGMEYKTVSEADGKKCAQLMMVMGTDAGGLYHPDWQSNLNFAANLQKQILQKYPTLMRPINLRAQRFNEQATTGSMILECGTSANTIGEAETAVKAFAQQLAQALKE